MRSPSFSRWTARGGLAAMVPASSSAVGSSSSWGTTRETSPMASASSASIDASGEQQLGRPLAADELGEPADAGDVGAQAAVHEQLAELGPLRRHPEVGHQRQLHAPPDGGAVDRGDDRHVGVEQRVGGRA